MKGRKLPYHPQPWSLSLISQFHAEAHTTVFSPGRPSLLTSRALATIQPWRRRWWFHPLIISQSHLLYTHSLTWSSEPHRPPQTAMIDDDHIVVYIWPVWRPHILRQPPLNTKNQPWLLKWLDIETVRAEAQRWRRLWRRGGCCTQASISLL